VSLGIEKNNPRGIQHIAAGDYLPFADSTDSKHVFLAGDLQRPTPNPFFRESALEVVRTFYEPGDGGLPHWHEHATEYEMVLSGRIGYQEAGTTQVQWFEPGDFLRVPPGICVTRKIEVQTRTLAVKTPSGYDKVYCDACPRDCSTRIAPFEERR
jgi:hypothetical protein